jgi:hypothetical protein
MVCPKCGGDMKCSFALAKLPAVLRCRTAVIAIIEDPDELKRILRHLINIGRSPPGFDLDRLN